MQKEFGSQSIFIQKKLGSRNLFVKKKLVKKISIQFDFGPTEIFVKTSWSGKK